jgi:hypothetical protein
VTRPPFEVADVIRRAGSKFIDRYRRSLTWGQLKVLRAIERCRTAALGGHRDRCLDCLHRSAISFHSCLMGSFLLWGVRRAKGMKHGSSERE